jgi:hypothetical protein
VLERHIPTQLLLEDGMQELQHQTQVECDRHQFQEQQYLLSQQGQHLL